MSIQSTRGAALLLLGMPALLCAQQQTVHSAMLWGAAFGDHRFGARSALYWDAQPRRADAGERWQILLGAVGYTRDITPRWRATAALGATRGYRYGVFSRNETVELRPWVQLQGTRPAGGFTWSDRTRVEFRVLRATGAFAPADADWQSTVVRLRRQDRLQHRLTEDGRWYGAASQEFMVNVHPARVRFAALEQSRTQLLLGRELTRRNRIESGYGLQYFTRRGGVELNHTLLVYFRSSTPFR